MNDASPTVILASASPRRTDLLKTLGIEHTVEVPDLVEEAVAGESPQEMVERLARDKASQVARARRERGSDPASLVIAGDTVVVLDRIVLGKPSDGGEAAEMLRSLQGRSHRVCSGLALIGLAGRTASGHSDTEVRFRPLDDAQIEAYVRTGEPLDKAGAYGIQGLGSALIHSVVGDHSTVVGFPIPLFLDLLHAVGLDYRFGRGIVSRTDATTGDRA